MLPQFPEMRNLSLSDAADIECITKTFPPYSDFNFVNMWSWDVAEQLLVSNLHNNLVVRFQDYLSPDFFLTFIGRERPNETACALLALSQSSGLQPQLRWIPHCIGELLDASVFSISDQPAHMDYIISTRLVETYEGQRLALQRNFVRRFLANHPDVQFTSLDLSRDEVHEQICLLYVRWHLQKEREVAVREAHEFAAIKRCLDAFSSRLIATGLLSDNRLIAFWLGEHVGGASAVCHFEKAETTRFVGIVPYLRQQTARVLLERGIEHLNLEQDLGVPGLRQSKRSYAPVAHLKKCEVSRCVA
jgi:hypothetical protein